MVTFTINIPPMLAYIPYMDPMGFYPSKKHSKERTVGQEVAGRPAERSLSKTSELTQDEEDSYHHELLVGGLGYMEYMEYMEMICKLVVWNMILFFPYIGNNSIIFQRGSSTTNQIIAWCITPSLQRLGPWQGICQWANAESHKAVIRIHRSGWKAYLSMDWFKGKFTGNHRFSH